MVEGERNRGIGDERESTFEEDRRGESDEKMNLKAKREEER